MTRSKECFKCKSVKPLNDFYKHPMMADGHLNKCKECAKKDVGEHRELNLEKIRAYDRDRSKLPHRKALVVSVTRAWRSKDLRRQRAHQKVRAAILKGLIERKPCIECGSDKSQAHHPDYDKPLEVIWLCQVHHSHLHKKPTF